MSASNRTSNRRRQRLVHPRTQLTLCATFLGTGLFCLVFQMLLTWVQVARLAERLPEDGDLLQSFIPGALATSLLFSVGVLLPLTMVVGIQATLRVSGPLYRFGEFLRSVRDGERPADCKIRKGDFPQDVCALMNEATRPLREQPALPGEDAQPGEDARAA